MPNPRPTALTERQSDQNWLLRANRKHRAWLETEAGKKWAADIDEFCSRCQAGLTDRTIWFEGLP